MKRALIKRLSEPLHYCFILGSIIAAQGNGSSFWTIKGWVEVTPMWWHSCSLLHWLSMQENCIHSFSCHVCFCISGCYRLLLFISEGQKELCVQSHLYRQSPILLPVWFIACCWNQQEVRLDLCSVSFFIFLTMVIAYSRTDKGPPLSVGAHSIKWVAI